MYFCVFFEIIPRNFTRIVANRTTSKLFKSYLPVIDVDSLSTLFWYASLTSRIQIMPFSSLYVIPENKENFETILYLATFPLYFKSPIRLTLAEFVSIYTFPVHPTP